jgi:osmotically-inducible protein OsmY
METMLIKTDADIQRDVLRELQWDPHVDSTDVGVTVAEGIVTLTGSVGSCARKRTALDAAHRAAGVLDVVDEIEVRFPSAWTDFDVEIAQRVREALIFDASAPDQQIRCTVSKGWVTLEGEVDYAYQRMDAAEVVERQDKVRGVVNLLVVKPRVIDESELRSSIMTALSRQSEREAQHIDIRVKDGFVTLGGTVHSWAEKNAIAQLARHAQGVRGLRDEMVVGLLR